MEIELTNMKPSIIEKEDGLNNKLIFTPFVSFIGKSAFNGCSSLTKIQLSRLVCIKSHFFNNCISLKEITITYIKDELFSKCSSLPRITIPSSVRRWLK